MALSSLLPLFNIAIGLIAIVFLISVVWHVEKKLDISFKFFLLAALIFVMGEFLDVFESVHIISVPREAGYALDTLFTLAFMAGVLEIRWLLASLGSKKKQQQRAR